MELNIINTRLEIFTDSQQILSHCRNISMAFSKQKVS